MDYQFDDKGQPISAQLATGSSTASQFRLIFGMVLTLAGVYLGFTVAYMAMGIVRGEPPELLSQFTDPALSKIAEANIEGNETTFILPQNVVHLAAYVLCFLLLLIPCSIATGLVRWGVHLIRADVAELKQLIQSLRE